MRTDTIEIYKFDELSDKAKENARNWWRSHCDFHWTNENQKSINAFCDYFGIRLTQFSVAPYQLPDYNAEYFNSHFRGLKLCDFDRDHMPTGYWLDYPLWSTFYDQFKATGCAKKAFDAALWQGFLGWRNDMESQLSNEYIDDHLIINEYEFTENGKIY